MKRTIAGFCVLVILISGFFILNTSTGMKTELENTKIISPENNAEVKGDVTITAEVMTCDCNGMTSLYVDGVFITEGTPGRMSEDGTYEIFIHVWDSTTAVDGVHKAVVYGKHDEYSDEITINVNNGGGGGGQPESVKIISPEENAVVKGDVTITAEVLACFCYGTTSLYIDGEFITEGTPGKMTEDGNYEVFIHVWDSTSASDGAHKIMVFGKHNEDSDGMTIVVNNNGGGGEQPDHIRIISPEDNAEVNGDITVKAEVMACFCASVTYLHIDGIPVAEGTRDSMSDDGVYEIFVHEWDTSEFTNGGHKITVFDKHNEYSQSITVFVNNDGGGPPEKYLKIVSHNDEDSSNGKIIITAEVKSNENSDPTSLYVNDEFISEGQYLDDVEYDGEIYNVYIHEWDSTDVEDGMYSIRVSDNNNAEYDEVQLYVENSGKDINEIETDPEKNERTIYIQMFIILIVGILAIIVLALKKSTRK